MFNWLPHILGNISRVLGSDPSRAMGEGRVRNHKAPYLGAFHDVRDSYAASNAGAEAAEWRDGNAESGFRELLEYPFGREAVVDVQISVDLECSFPGESPMMRIYGETGTLEAEGIFTFDVRIIGPDGTIPQPLPEALRQTGEESGSSEQDKWNAFFGEFVTDVSGRSSSPKPPCYPTFHDGYRDLLVMDAILSERSWQAVSAD